MKKRRILGLLLALGMILGMSVMASAETHTSLQVGDVIKEGDTISFTQDTNLWGSDWSKRQTCYANTPLVLIRIEDPNGSYYGFKFVNGEIKNDFGKTIPATKNSKGVLVKEKTTDTIGNNSYPTYKLEAHEIESGNSGTGNTSAGSTTGETATTQTTAPTTPTTTTAPKTATEQPTSQEKITIMKAPVLKKLKSKKNKVLVSWNKIKKNKAGKKLFKQIRYIEVQAATDPAFKNIVATRNVGKKKTKATLKLARKTTYYVRVRYVGTDGVSKWSKIKKVKTK